MNSNALTLSIVSVALLTACGTADNGASAGRARIGAIDLVEPTATPTPAPLSVSVLDANGQPKSDVPLVLSNVDGAYLATATTDASGTATAKLTQNAIVSMVDETPAQHSMRSVAGVAPGMSVRFADPAGAPAQGGTLDVTLPGSRPDSSWYFVYTQCASAMAENADADVVLSLTAACSSSNTTVLVVARDASWAAVAWTTQDVALDDSYTAVTMPAWRTDFDAVSLNAHNAPASITDVSAQIGVVHNGLLYADFSADHAVAAGEGSAFSSLVPAGFGDAIVYDVAAGFNDGASSILEHRVSRTNLALAIDLDAELLPHVTVSPAGSDVSLITWTTAKPVTTGAVRVDAQWANTDNTWNWSMLAPNASRAPLARIVDVPSELSSAHPTNDAQRTSLSVILFDADFATSFATVAAMGGEFPAAPDAPDLMRISTTGE